MEKRKRQSTEKSNLLLAISLLLAIVLFSGCVHSERVVQYNSYQDDLITLYNQLAINHINFFNSVESKDGRILLEDLIHHVKDGKSLFMASLQIAALAHDSHTNVYLTERIRNTLSVLPFNASYIDGKYYVTTSGPELKDYLGCEIVEIASYPIERIIDRFRPYLPSDNDLYTHLIFPQYLNIGDIYRNAGIARTNSLLIKFRNSDSETFVVNVQFKNARRYLEGAIYNYKFDYPETFITNRPYNIRSLDNGTLFIQCNACRDDMEYPIVLLVEDLKRILPEYNKVILDFRFNSGGNSSVFEPVIDAVSENIKDDTKVIALIGHATFSSAILNVKYLKEKISDSLFIGMPTGGLDTHYGELGMGTLPNSNMTYTYSTKLFGSSDTSGENIEPDIYIPITFEDLNRGYDAALDVAIRL